VAPRATERVGDHHGDARTQRRAQAARRPVGVLGQQDHRPRPGVRGVDAGVGAHEAVAGAADEHAALGAEDLGRLVEHDLHVARVLAVTGGELDGPLAGLHAGEVDDAALGLGDRLVGDDEHVAFADVGGQQGGEVLAAPDLGEPGDRLGADHRARSTAARSSTVSTSTANATRWSTTQGSPASAAREACRSQLPGPKAGAIASGGVSSSPLVPVPWRSASTTTPGVAAVVLAEQVVEVAGGQQRAVAGDEQDGPCAALERRRDTERRRRAVAAQLALLDNPGPVLDRERLRVVVAGDHERRVDRRRRERAQDALGHLAHHRGAVVEVQALLGVREALDRQDGDRRHGPHRRARAKSSVSRATRSRVAGSPIIVSVTSATDRQIGALVGDDPVEQLAVGGGDARRVHRLAACSRNAAVGPLEHLSVDDRADRATTGAAAGGERLAGSGDRRIGPIEMTGLLGPITIARAAAIASGPRAARRVAAPPSATSSIGPSPRRRIMNS
jgi:hypothetical protein